MSVSPTTLEGELENNAARMLSSDNASAVQVLEADRVLLPMMQERTEAVALWSLHSLVLYSLDQIHNLFLRPGALGTVLTCPQRSVHPRLRTPSRF